jgi:hypothetical protein
MWNGQGRWSLPHAPKHPANINRRRNANNAKSKHASTHRLRPSSERNTTMAAAIGTGRTVS